ncbi:MAG: N-glycosylase/DNA lyase [Candidatus Omnitrophica bacterium]|nr:N-glycosylase/DNA lyase [Candidatus Omnitrophota bacterium]
MKKLLKTYRLKKSAIRKRLSEFKKVQRRPDKKIFSELCFCITTPQSKAVYCDRSIRGLEKSGALFKGSVDKIRSGLTGVRFPNNKARFISEARKLFTTNGKVRVKDKLRTEDILSTRKWLVENVKGIGFKEASHFLRNIGLGGDLAILDVHILKNMKKYGIIKEPPKDLSGKNYLIIEKKLRKFSEKIGIPMDELDLLFWSEETGQIFK